MLFYQSLLFSLLHIDVVRAVPAPSSCHEPVIKTVNSILQQYPITASKICSKILNRNPAGGTATVTSFTTTTETVTAFTGTTIEYVESGYTTVTIPSTFTILTGSETYTETAITTDEQTKTVTRGTTTITVDGPTKTVYTSTTTNYKYTNALIPTPQATATVAKRDEAFGPRSPRPMSSLSFVLSNLAISFLHKREDTLGQRYPGLPKQLSTVVLSIATKACNCFLPTAAPSTTVTTTSTATSTATVSGGILTTTETVESATSSIFTTITFEIPNEEFTTITSTSTSFVATTTVKSTVTQTRTTTVKGVATKTASATVKYEKKHEKLGVPAYAYRSPVGSGDRVSKNAPPYYTPDDCATFCDQRSDCKYWHYFEENAGYRNQDGSVRGDVRWCYFSEMPFPSQRLFSTDTARYSLGYDKGSNVTVIT